jgi:transcriptional regulator with XRE-family HTH domain
MDDIDLHVGKRVRRRRRLLGMTQQTLADLIGTRFQQVQKYECGANRLSASRLYRLATALRVPANYFFDGLPDTQPEASNTNELSNEVFSQTETIELIRAYYMLAKRPRQKLLDLAKALKEDNLSAA